MRLFGDWLETISIVLTPRACSIAFVSRKVERTPIEPETPVSLTTTASRPRRASTPRSRRYR
jgi:hypothetical protein